MTGKQVWRTPASATAFKIISGPMPAGSPIVIPIRGLSGLPGARVTGSIIARCGRAAPLAALLYRRFLNTLVAVDFAVTVLGIFNLVQVLNVVFQHQQVGALGSMKL